MTDYGYRSITTRVNAVAGVIQRGNRQRGQRKGQRFVLTSPTNIRLNMNGMTVTSVTVLTADGRAQARLEPNTVV